MCKFVKFNIKKLLLSFLVFVLLATSNLSFFVPAAHAQTWYNQNPFEWYVKVYDENTSPPNEIFGERYTAAQVQWVLWSVIGIGFNLPFTMLGASPGPAVCAAKFAVGTADVGECLTAIEDFIKDMTTKILPFFPSGTAEAKPNNMFAKSSGATSMWGKIFLEDRPISGIAYVRNIGRKLNLVPEAKAADSFGFSRLMVIQDFWKFSRNIAYFFFVLAIIITAFMIMFKVKISPQAVVGIQSALPKIIATLILVTFSYAIAGFLIDLMYVVMGILSVFLSASHLTLITSPSGNFEFINGGAMPRGIITILIYAIMFLVLHIVASFLALLTALVSGGATGMVWSLLLLVFTVILLFILIAYLFIITFALYKALAGFYFAVILGPLQLSAGALPQSRGTLGSWIKSVISKLAVFPATGILFYLAMLFAGKSIDVSISSLVTGNIISELLKEIPVIKDFFSGTVSGNLWGPPMLGEAASATSIAFILMSVSCILIIPKVQKAIESALKGREFDMESAIAQPIKTTVGTAGGIVEGATHGTPAQGTGKIIGSILQGLAR